MIIRNRCEVRTGTSVTNRALYSLVFLLVTFGLLRGSQAQAGGFPSSSCQLLDSFRDREEDASQVLQACIDSMTVGGVLEILPGNYTLGTSIKISKAIVIKTRGISTDAPTCTGYNAPRCATFRAAATLGDNVTSPNQHSQFSAVMFYNPPRINGVTFDHIVLDARRELRGSSEGVRCTNGKYSPTVFLNGPNIKIRKSVIQNTFCGSHAIIVAAKNLEITDSIFENAGTHSGPWADGVTVLSAEDAVVARNQFRNNTDIDLIFGGCPNCTIELNRVTHSGGFASSSFGSIMMHAWPNTSGDYTGTTVSDNYVDCGGLGCGQAFIVGSLGWYTTQVTRGFRFAGNVAVNAPAGFVIGSDVDDVLIGDNYASRNVGNQKCSGRQLYDYALAPGSGAHFMAGNQVGQSYYASSSLAGFIPNTNACSPSTANLLPPPPATKAERVFRFIIQSAYQEILARPANQNEISKLLPDFIAGTLTESELRKSMLKSSEFLTPWVAQKYRLLLKRCPDAWEVAIWRNAIAGGRMTAAEVVRAIVESEQAKEVKDKAIPARICPVPTTGRSSLLAGQWLPEGSRLQVFGENSACSFNAVMQNDGNFVIYQVNTGPIWSTKTAQGEGTYRLLLQADGNLVLYQGAASPMWSSRTAGSSGSKLILQPDGNLVLYNQATQPIWASGSVVAGCS